jgi:hypothetical protein
MYMGNFSLWHWIIVLFILAIPIVIGLIIWLVVRAARRPAATSTVVPPPSAIHRSSAESRLRELADLKAKGLVTDTEYEDQRATILQDV